MKAIDLSDLLAEFHALDHVKYLWGAKPPLSTPASQIQFGDCSWLTKRLLGKQGVVIPDGSVNQRDWFLANCEHKSFADILKFTEGDPGRLFAFGYDRTRPGKPRARHIGFCRMCKTIESGSSIGGVGSRPAENFRALAQWAVEIPVK